MLNNKEFDLWADTDRKNIVAVVYFSYVFKF